MAPYAIPEERSRAIAKALFPNSNDKWDRGAPTDQRGVPLFNFEELRKAGSQLKVGKPPGPDGLTSSAVKTIVEEVPCILLRMFNDLLKIQRFPTDWKIARVVLIPKLRKPIECASTYRPICLLNCLGKF